jgi:hypothetical protein
MSGLTELGYQRVSKSSKQDYLLIEQSTVGHTGTREIIL